MATVKIKDMVQVFSLGDRVSMEIAGEHSKLPEGQSWLGTELASGVPGFEVVANSNFEVELIDESPEEQIRKNLGME